MTKETKPGTNDGFFYNLSEVKQHIIALAILFLVPFVLFTATTIGGKEFQRHDTTQWRAGSESVFEHREKYDEEPLWVENMYMGMPAYVVSVKNNVPHITFIGKFFNKIYPAFPYWIMLSGMYYLFILMGFRPLTAVFGSLLFSLTTYFPIIIGAGHATKFMTLAFIPWVFIGYWKLTRSDNKLAGLLLFTVAMALEVRAGHPQITYYFMFLLGFLWVSDSWKWIKESEHKKVGLITGLLLIGGIVGIMNHAQNLLTLREYAEFSIRGGSALDGTTGLSTGYAFAWSQGIKETLTLLVPDFFGGASPTYFGPKTVTSGPHYLGALVLPFLLIALFKIKSRVMFVLFGTGTLAIFFAWGSNFALLNDFAFNYIPMFNKFRAPETWLVVTAFTYTVVAVYGLDWFLKYAQDKAPTLKTLYAPLASVILVFAFVFIQVKTMDFTKQGEVENIAQQIAQQNQLSASNPQVQQQAANYVQQNFVPDRQESANRDIFRLGMILVIGGIIIWFTLNQKLSVSLASFSLILIAGFDMINVDKRYIPENVIVEGNVNPERYIKSQKRDIDQYIIDNVYDDNNIYEYRTFPLLDGAFQNAIPSYFYPTIGGYTGAKLSIVADLQKNGGPIYQGNAGLNLNLLSALNIKFLTYQPGLQIPGLLQVFSSQSGAVYENINVLPKAYFVESITIAESAQDAFDFVSNPNVDYSKSAVVETTQQLTASVDSSATVKVTEYNAREINLNVERSTPGFLVLSEVYYPAGWKAFLNGEEIPIYKTNYVLRGMEIPAGEHKLTLRFEPSSYSLGVTLGWISMILQIVLAVIVGLSYLKQRKSA